jgi:hypothetical protein
MTVKRMVDNDDDDTRGREAEEKDAQICEWLTKMKGNDDDSDA